MTSLWNEQYMRLFALKVIHTHPSIYSHFAEKHLFQAKIPVTLFLKTFGYLLLISLVIYKDLIQH